MSRDIIIGWIAILIADGALGLVVYSAWKLICAFSYLRDLGSTGEAEPLPEMDIESVPTCRAISEAVAVVWPAPGDDSGAMVEEVSE